MSSINRLLVCLRCTASRLSVADIVLTETKFSLWGNLLAGSRTKSTTSWPLFTRAISSRCLTPQPVAIRYYRTARTETTGFDQNLYDEHEVCICYSI